MPTDRDLRRFAGWPGGVNNVDAEAELPRRFLRAGVNVDFDNAGRPRRRGGSCEVRAGGGMRGLWSDPALSFGLFEQLGALKALREDGTASTLIASGVGGALPVAYACVLEQAYWSDGTRIGRVLDDLSLRPLGCESPAGAPIVAAYATGGFDAGAYLVAITFSDADGEESGASLAVEIELTQGQGLQLSSIPQPADAATTAINVFVSQCDGTELYHRVSVPAGTTSWIVGSMRKGRMLETQFLSPMPAGHLLAYFKGHLLSAVGNTLWYSEPLRYGLTNRVTHYTRFGGQINMVLPIDDKDGAGVYLAAGGKTYWLDGTEPRKWQKAVAYASDAVLGTGVMVPADMLDLENVPTPRLPMWLAQDGVFCYGLPGGRVQPFSADYFLADHATEGASLVRKVNGLRQVLMATDQGTHNNAKFTDSMTSVVYRHGVEVD